MEGLHDKFFFEHFLIESGLSNVGVYEIATVEVATSDVIKRGLEDGERGRVVALACLLEDQVELNEVVCIADADFDHFKKSHTIARYFFCPITLRWNCMLSMTEP